MEYLACVESLRCAGLSAAAETPVVIIIIIVITVIRYFWFVRH